MNTVKCPGCAQTFQQGISIKAHQKTCNAFRLVGQQQIKKRLDNSHKREVVKLARIEGQTMDDIAEERRELRDEPDDNGPAHMDDIADERQELRDEPDEHGPAHPPTHIPEQMTESSMVMINVLWTYAFTDNSE